MKNFLLKTLLAGLALTLAAPLGSASFFQQVKTYENAELKAGKVTIHSVIILPPQIEMRKSKVKSSEELPDVEHKLEETVPRILREVLSQHHCSVLKGRFSKKVLISNTNLKYTLADLQKQFDTLDTKIERKPEDVRQGRFSLGYAVDKLNPGGEADAVIFVRGNGELKTGGKMLVSGLTGHGAAMQFLTEIAVVDARTGKVLYYTYVIERRPDLLVKRPARLTKPITKGFKKFPGPKASK